MNAYRIFTQRFLGLDIRARRLVIILILLSLILLSYRIFKGKCIPFTIEVEKNSHSDTFFFAGETIHFFSSNYSEDINWSFKDETQGTAKGSSVLYTFNKEGIFFVTARMNEGCEFGKTIYIKQRPQPATQAMETTAGDITGADSTMVGKAELFISPIRADGYYEWEVLEHPEMGVKNAEKVSYTFDKADTYIIQLTLDGDRVKSFQKRLLVLDVPGKTILAQDAMPLRIEKEIEEIHEEPKEAPETEKLRQYSPETQQSAPPVESVAPGAPVIKVVAADVFRGYLQKLVFGEMNETEFYTYLCRGATTSVVVNGDNRNAKTFSQFCQEFKGKTEKGMFVGKKRPITIKSVKLIKDLVDTKCIHRIEVEH